MRNTWWITRPKRNLVSVPLCLSVMAHHAQGKVWSSSSKETELAIEAALEDANLKRKGKRRDQLGGGARTYRAWMKSLGLLFMDEEGKMWLTSAGEALVNSEPPLDILKKQVLSHQYPSSATSKGPSRVADRFKVRPFIFLLQLLLDERLGGYLNEKEEIGKLVITYGESNKQSDVDKVVELILQHRGKGDSVLPTNYLAEFASSRSKNPTLETVFEQHKDIANTFGNWLGYTQLIQREAGEWSIPADVRQEAEAIVQEYLSTPLIKDHEDEEKFQRRYGLKPGQRKDTRNLDSSYASRTSAAIEADQIKLVMMEISTTRLIDEIDYALVKEISERTGSNPDRVEQVLAEKYPNGAVDSFMHGYVELAFQSRDKATEFEKATAEILDKIFGFNTKHMGQEGIRPDIVISSEPSSPKEESYSGVLDNKAYKRGYSITHDQRNAMRTYIETFNEYRIDEAPLKFFCYVVSEYKSTINSQIKQVSEMTGVPGSAITARDIVRLARLNPRPTHQEFLELFTSNKVIDVVTWIDKRGK